MAPQPEQLDQPSNALGPGAGNYDRRAFSLHGEGDGSFERIQGVQSATGATDLVERLVTSGDTSWPPADAREKSGAESWAGKSLGECGAVLLSHILEVFPLRSSSMGRGDPQALFPLPTSRNVISVLLPELNDCELIWMECVVRSLNSVWDSPHQCREVLNEGQKQCLKGLSSQVVRFCGMEAKVEDVIWEDFFRIRSIDYKGEEIRVARWFAWKNVAPALPSEIGVVPLEEVCTHGSRHYVTHFQDFLKPSDEWDLPRAPRVMVDDTEWPAVCAGLLHTGVCCLLEEDEVFTVRGEKLLNGLFGVSKDDWTPEGDEIFRIIMNLVPLNSLCRPMSGDVDTLPAWGGMSPFFLQPTEQLLISSEDVKCFFYTMKVPDCWVRFLAFNKPVPDEVLPQHLRGSTVYLASRVLPMGFLNSVSLAQHVHRNLVAWGGARASGEPNAPEQELRKDRAFTVSNPNWRVYLDNYDLLERVEASSVVALAHTTAPGVLALRQEYEEWGVPRNVKKSVERSSLCEVQGATVDGVRGIAYPRETKLAKYFGLAVKLATSKFATQKQWQVVCGGLVYVTMFRRPLLGCLNQVWRHIESFSSGLGHLQPVPVDCCVEILRLVGLMPLACLDFRLGMHPQVTCSDASTQGGGICASMCTTAVGATVAQGELRGAVPEPRNECQVLVIGLFDGIGALRVALEVLEIPVLGYISVEIQASARRVVESHFPGVEHVQDVRSISPELCLEWSAKYSQAGLVILGAGPPCQGVSGLNSDRKGALRDHRSNLFQEVPRVRDLVKRYFCWCPVYTLMESVASMDQSDCAHMSTGIGGLPLKCDAACLSWCHRPRLYWCDWEIVEAQGFQLSQGQYGIRELILEGHQPLDALVKAGWTKVTPDKPFPTFTTSRPRQTPGRKPAGIQQCSEAELDRWTQDQYRFPPYQYCTVHCLRNRAGDLRLPDAEERELMMGFPLKYTSNCLPKAQQKGEAHHDCRLTLLGNSWSVPVVSCLLSQLFVRLGLCRPCDPQDVVDRLTPGKAPTVQGRLFRLPLNPVHQRGHDQSASLAFKLGNLVSIKGEDIMVNSSTSQQAKFHRLRATVPAKCWKWRVVAGWKWTGTPEHINSLELRAILTSLRWRLEHQRHQRTRFIHLTDSLVCLHALSRGRSSSRKLRRTMSRISALILATSVHPVWGYVHTHQNPADKPSRWGRRVRSKFRNAKKKIC